MRPRHGFTLVELMVVLVVGGVLAFAAQSAWMTYWERTRRAAGAAALVAALVQLEVRHARTGRYDDGVPRPKLYVDGYSIRSQPCSGVEGTELPPAQCIQVIAIPEREDPACGMLVLRSTGERWPEDSACWP
ncbi:prepilin-type N-terminal cleavage/methylation domain-containing protein [Ralstonia sp. UNC404CL21Col]|uniref:prepilin-type N-terminal cleavage/methylation domain-containing protein n=1 Tax=Ralstonia sp. UNC404CL21Col TaxID=1380362 RepID=UPI0004832C9C